MTTKELRKFCKDNGVYYYKVKERPSRTNPRLMEVIRIELTTDNEEVESLLRDLGYTTRMDYKGDIVAKKQSKQA